MNETPNESQMAYRKVLAVFDARLQMKHLLKGTSFKDMELFELREILILEIIEMDKEINSDRIDHIIEEACDVMICAMMIAHKVWLLSKGGPV